MIFFGRKPLEVLQHFVEGLVRQGKVRVGVTIVQVEHDEDCLYPQNNDLCICRGGPTIRIEEPDA